MSDLVCPECGTWEIDFKAAHWGVARGASFNDGEEWCRASLTCQKCEWYTCLG